MSEQRAPARQRQKTQQDYFQKPKSVEFSKKLTFADIIVYVITITALIIILYINPSLGLYVKELFGYATTAYVSLRLGYTAKAGIENFQKISKTLNAPKTLDEEENVNTNG